MPRYLSSSAILIFAFAAAAQQPRTPRETLQSLGDLVGTWRGTGVPAGTREEQQKNFWVETLSCEWKFKGTDAWLVLKFDKSKHFTAGELRFLPDKNVYQIQLKTTADKTLTLSGELKSKTLTLDDESGSERLVFTMLHDNRFLYRKDVRPEGKTTFVKSFQVGATKEGVAFAVGSGQPECIVTGGLGTIAVAYQGKTYYVCCSGCRDEFNADPARYVKEAEGNKAKK